jgi:hypothetical protein
MKNKTSVPKQQPVPPLKTDELIALLKASYDESVNSVFDIVDQLFATLLLLQRVLEDDDIMEHDLTMNFTGEHAKLPSPAYGVAQIIKLLPGQLYKARCQIDGTSTKVMIEMGRYEEVHREVAAS